MTTKSQYSPKSAKGKTARKLKTVNPKDKPCGGKRLRSTKK